jgi:hypothetical protein
MTMKKFLIGVAIAFVVWFIIQQPLSAAHVVRNGEHQVSHGANSTSQFVNGVAGGN